MSSQNYQCQKVHHRVHKVFKVIIKRGLIRNNPPLMSLNLVPAHTFCEQEIGNPDLTQSGIVYFSVRVIDVMARSYLSIILTGLIISLPSFRAAATVRKSYQEVLDADARIFLWHHFLTEGWLRVLTDLKFCMPSLAYFPVYSPHVSDECDHIRAKAEKRLERSGVVGRSLDTFLTKTHSMV